MNNPDLMQQQMSMMQSMMSGGVDVGNTSLFGEVSPTGSTPSSASAANPWASPVSTMANPESMPLGSTAPAMPPVNPWANIGSSGDSANNTPAASMVSDEQRFATQLEQLEGMGFTDRTRNIVALRATNGVVHSAVERLLGGL